MAIISEDFDRFLKANNSDDYLKISVHDVADDVKNSVVSRNDYKYEIWKRIPEWIREIFLDRLPEELLRGNEPWDTFVLHLQDTHNDYTKIADIVYNTIIRDEDNVRYCNNILAKGWSFENAVLLTELYDERKKLWESGEINTPEGKKKLRESREKENKIRKKEYKEHQPDMWALRQLREYDRNIRKSDKAETHEKVVEYKLKANKNQEEYKKYIELVEDKETRRRLEHLNKTLHTNKDRRKILDEIQKVDAFVKEQHVKVAMKHIKPNTVDFIYQQMNGGRK